VAGGADHVEARIALARALVTMDSVDAALGVLRAAEARYPDEAWVVFWLGTIQLERGSVAAGIDALRKAVSREPHFMEAQVKLGEALVRAGRLDEARLQLERVVELDPLHQPQSWYNLGLMYLQQGSGSPALVAFQEAARLDPDLVDAHNQLGTAYLQHRRLDEAERAFRSAIAAGEDNPAGYGSLALVFLQRGETTRARQLLETVLRLDPTNQTARALINQLR
jgi:tetratricopeptide (TPR) repeat protein